MSSGSNPLSRDLRGRHVLITGGSSGIGLALAQQAAAAGAKVSLIARSREKLDAARTAIRVAVPAATDIAVAAGDVAVQREALGALAEVERVHGAVEVLITSAGVAQAGYFEAMPVEVFERAMAVNYFGTLYLLKAVVPAMRRRGSGAVVLISSGAGLWGFFGYTAYGPSKFAVCGLAESLRAELQGTGVQVSVCCPPDTDTPQLTEEIRTRPVETTAAAAHAGMWTADAVARVTLVGLARGQFLITPGLALTALAWWRSLVAPGLRWWFDRTARRVRR